jgi:hypothetical protein
VTHIRVGNFEKVGVCHAENEIVTLLLQQAQGSPAAPEAGREGAVDAGGDTVGPQLHDCTLHKNASEASTVVLANSSACKAAS